MSKKLLSVLLAVILLAASVLPVWADEYIDLDDVPYEEIILPPWFTSPGLPYIIEPDMALWLVFYNIFLKYGEIYAGE